MDSLKPADIVENMVAPGIVTVRPGPLDLLVRGAPAGVLLGFATSLAVGATMRTGQPIVGAQIFPAGFVMIAVLGLALHVTSSRTGEVLLAPPAADAA